MLWKIFIISLAREHARREKALAQIQSTGWDFELCDAVDAKTVDRKVLTIPGDASLLREGEVACYLSHLSALQRLCDQDLDYAIILEDDYQLTEGTSMTLATIWDHLPQGADHVQLHNVQAHFDPRYRKLESGERFNRVKPTNYGTWAYLISRRLAEHVLAHHSIPRMPIDRLYIKLSRSKADEFGFHDTTERLVDCCWEVASSMNRKRFAPRSIRMMFRCWFQKRKEPSSERLPAP